MVSYAMRNNMDTVNGYKKLFDELCNYEARLREIGNKQCADIIGHTAKFYGGIPQTDFMEESLVALRTVIREIEGQVSPDLEKSVRLTLKEVEMGFSPLRRMFHRLYRALWNCCKD